MTMNSPRRVDSKRSVTSDAPLPDVVLNIPDFHLYQDSSDGEEVNRGHDPVRQTIRIGDLTPKFDRAVAVESELEPDFDLMHPTSWSPDAAALDLPSPDEEIEDSIDETEAAEVVLPIASQAAQRIRPHVRIPNSLPRFAEFVPALSSKWKYRAFSTIGIGVVLFGLWSLVGRDRTADDSADISVVGQVGPEVVVPSVDPMADSPLRVEVPDGQRVEIRHESPKTEPVDDLSGIAGTPASEARRKSSDLFDQVRVLEAERNTATEAVLPEQERAAVGRSETPQGETSEFPTINRANGKAWNDTTSVNRAGRVPADSGRRERSPQTIYEWGESMAERESGRSRDASRDRLAEVQPEETPVEQEFTYQKTDPSRYKDPVYEVPPLTGRRVNPSRYPMR